MLATMISVADMYMAEKKLSLARRTPIESRIVRAIRAKSKTISSEIAATSRDLVDAFKKLSLFRIV
ncbi:MAG: hypothetical protein CW694_00750 [Candidatus Syntrophoarchaeum sp. WYZ-LMO15]|nr:MAG: hypothetical protein CW694_00750 [Candidatus Syntrophoarchaeum sp. WYZ-LMO15]